MLHHPQILSLVHWQRLGNCTCHDSRHNASSGHPFENTCKEHGQKMQTRVKIGHLRLFAPRVCAFEWRFVFQ